MTQKKENPWINLIINIVIPVAVMSKGEQWFGLSPLQALLMALGFPIAYGLYDLIARKKCNVLSIVGLVSLLVTGGIGLWELPTEWVAWKEAAVPTLIALITLGSLKTRYPLVKTLLYRDELLNVELIEERITQIGGSARLQELLTEATYGLCGSFALSAVLNFALAKWIVVSPAGTQAFTQQIAKMTLWSLPVIVIPSTAVLMWALWRLVKGISQLTGLPLESLLKTQST